VVWSLEVVKEVLILAREVFELETRVQLQTTRRVSGHWILEIGRHNARIWRDVRGCGALMKDRVDINQLKEIVFENCECVVISQPTSVVKQARERRS
jgi:hypothetical protein